jgi:hypothetical protein
MVTGNDVTEAGQLRLVCGLDSLSADSTIVQKYFEGQDMPALRSVSGIKMAE